MTKVLFRTGFDTLLAELYKIVVIEVTFLGFRGAIAPIAPLWICPCWRLRLQHWRRFDDGARSENEREQETKSNTALYGGTQFLGTWKYAIFEKQSF